MEVHILAQEIWAPRKLQKVLHGQCATKTANGLLMDYFPLLLGREATENLEEMYKYQKMVAQLLYMLKIIHIFIKELLFLVV